MTLPEPGTLDLIHQLVNEAGGDPENLDGRMVTEMIATALKLAGEGHDSAQLKLINSALKELRYAYRVFNTYRGARKLSIFGSARTPPEHADFIAARELGERMAERGWMTITGGGEGIMAAGHAGASREASFGLSIRLPFENNANPVIADDPKLINFRYFFTRKVMFLNHSDALVMLPGGFGTMDEAFESLVLTQTGKSPPLPIILLEGNACGYWCGWERYVRDELLARGWISEDDLNLFRRVHGVVEAEAEILRFYHRYHSSRYVDDRLVIRLLTPLSPAELARLNEEFADLVAAGRIEQRDPLPEEGDELPELPRLVFRHIRARFGRLRQLIDRINRLTGIAVPPEAPRAVA